MVSCPPTIRTYCPNCNKHRVHKVSQYKKSKESKFAKGRRRYDMKQAGFGGQTKPILKRKAKTTKKTLLRLTCQCGAKNQRKLRRSKKFDIVKKA
ncbi:hypothetical protein PCE1_004687 [Barthelona sp. PCE]